MTWALLSAATAMLRLSAAIISIRLVQVMPFYIINQRKDQPWHTTRRLVLLNSASKGQDHPDNDRVSSFQSSAPVTKGLVSSLTSLANSILFGRQSTTNLVPAATKSSILSRAPTSPRELLSRIRIDYTENNYLWTGNLDTSSFLSNCTFTDPTLTFVGVEKYIENVGNLVPVVNFLLGDEQSSRSDLMSITLNEEEKYVETRWNMVGVLNNLFWTPKIDVIGRTKFWYQEVSRRNNEVEDSAFQVYFYDETWEIPAGLALLQLITPHQNTTVKE